MWSVAAPRREPPVRDPAPTRMAYRYQRIMLTPFLRRLITRWLPVGAVFGALALVALTPVNRARIAQEWQALRLQIEGMEEFSVTAMAISGASIGLQRQIRAALPYDFPQSRFDLDLAWMHEAVMQIPAVKSARIGIGPGRVLELNVEERLPVALWRRADGLVLLDVEGIVIGSAAARADFAGLPVMAGAGADAALGDLPHLRAALGPLAPRVRGFVRRGERRWDVVLDRNQRLMLPERRAVATLERVVALAQVSDLLERDVLDVDMRLPHRPTLRMSENAKKILSETRAAASKEQ